MSELCEDYGTEKKERLGGLRRRRPYAGSMRTCVELVEGKKWGERFKEVRGYEKGRGMGQSCR